MMTLSSLARFGRCSSTVASARLSRACHAVCNSSVAPDFAREDVNVDVDEPSAWQLQPKQLDAVLKVYATIASPNYTLPWQNRPQKEISGSAFVLDGKIVTNAHVVSDHKWVQLRKHGCPRKVQASVLSVSHDCDLALLGVDDAEFWKGLPSLQLGTVPQLQDEVLVAGYPSGGDNVCLTKGIVSRVEPQQYAHGASQLLAAQVDAAINSGNSGGPALLRGRVAGVAFQAFTGSENVGYIVPSLIIRHFLNDVEHPRKRSGFCSLGVQCQALESDHLRQYLKMPLKQSGVLVNKVRPCSAAHNALKPNDVLLEVDGHTIANDGTINWRNRERITFDYLLSLKYDGDTCRLIVLRDGHVLEPIDLSVFPEKLLTPVQQYDISSPDYFIFGGFVFTPLVQPLLHEWGDDWYNRAPRKLTELAMNETLEFDEQQIVVISQILSHQINVGYGDMMNTRVHRVEGEKVRNLSHLVEQIEHARKQGQEFVRIELDENRVLALNISAADDAQSDILARHRVPADRSLRSTHIS